MTDSKTTRPKNRRIAIAVAATVALGAGGAAVPLDAANAAGLGAAPSDHKSDKKKDKKKDKSHKKKSNKKKSKKRGKGGSCKASYYSSGSQTASGEKFKPSKKTAAHKKLKFGTKVKVTNKKNGKSVTVRINDRGPYSGGRCLDLSKGAMKKVKGTSAGVINAKWKVVSTPKK